MNQLTQQLKDGTMEIMEVPFPALDKGKVLIRNIFSVISAGTEGKTVSDARLGYIGKARSRKKELKMVFEMIKTQGLRETYKLVMNKLQAPSALGYSCAGEVIAVGEDIHDIKVGDLVACGGIDASHAEVVSVSRNLCVSIPEDVSTEHAAFSTIAAIAMQGIRQAELKVGENAVVIGLGLIGQITVQLLKASGVSVTGIDIDDHAVGLAIQSGADLSFNRNQAGLEESIINFSRGAGTDAVIITAGSSSLDPVELAGRICRRKGKVVIVGAVPTGFSRDHYYRKELDLRMSSSYGPGRYDPKYEEKGIDYPIGYVRWTENRNMQAYLDLLKQNKLNIGILITHRFSLDNSPDAYSMILNKTEKFIGITIGYEEEINNSKKVVINNSPIAPQPNNVGFIGAGSFAQFLLLPNLKGISNFVGVATSHGNTSRNIATKYGFSYCTGDYQELLRDERIQTVFIATRHSHHAKQVLDALKSGKNVFVEKPLCLLPEELDEISRAYSSANLHLMVGYNRRFSPHMQYISGLFQASQPKAIQIRINAGAIPADHWTQDKEVGGGRIIGEVCHFLDLAMFLAGSNIETVQASSIPDPIGLNDTIQVNLTFSNGSIAQIGYFANGSKKVAKERIEVFCHGTTIICDDFRKLTIAGSSLKKTKLPKQDKGHRMELQKFMEAVKEGRPTPVSFSEIVMSTKATFAVINSIREKRVVALNEPVISSEKNI